MVKGLGASSYPKAVFFDLDDTLVEERGLARAATLAASQLAATEYKFDRRQLYRAVRNRATELWRTSPWHELTESLGFSPWEGLWATFEGDYPWLRPLRAWRSGYQRDSWRRALDDLGVKDAALAEGLAQEFIHQRNLLHRLIPAATDILQAVSAMTRIAIVSNGPPDLQRRKLKATSLDEYFDVVVISGESGFGKPDPRIFESALSAHRVKPEEAVMVGDSWDRDVQGALQAGLSVVWITQSSSRRLEKGQVVMIPRLADLIAVLPLG